MKHFLTVSVLIAMAFGLPLATSAQSHDQHSARNKIVVRNDSNVRAWVTIYSLGKVNIEDRGYVEPHGVRVFHNGLYTDLTWHHVRYEWEVQNPRRVLCDTSAQIYFTAIGAETSGYYAGGSHCHVKVLRG